MPGMGGAPSMGGGMGGAGGAGGGMGGMAWLGAVLGGIGSAKAAYSANKNIQENYERWQRHFQNALKQLHVSKIMQLQQKLLPLFRANMGAAGFGGNFAESVRGALGSSGMLNSPMGIAIADAAAAAPSLKAFELSLGEALDISKMRAGLKMSVVPPLAFQPKQDVRTEFGLGLLRGMGVSGLNQGASSGADQMASAPASSSSMGQMGGGMPNFGSTAQRYPNLYGTEIPSRFGGGFA